MVDAFRTPRRRGKPKTTVNLPDDFMIGVFLKRFVSKAPYLIHHSSKTPDITKSGILLVVKSLSLKKKIASYS